MPVSDDARLNHDVPCCAVLCSTNTLCHSFLRKALGFQMLAVSVIRTEINSLSPTNRYYCHILICSVHKVGTKCLNWIMIPSSTLPTWRIKKPTRCHLIFYCTSYRLNMFQALLCPSSGACDYDVDYHIGRVVLGHSSAWYMLSL
jgi:hypothetical protein